MITKEFAFRLDVHPSKVSNAEMGTVFEELIRRFMESSKETAGERFTPREVIRLMVGLLFSSDHETLGGRAPMRQVYDPTCGTGGMLSVAEEWIAQHALHVKLTLGALVAFSDRVINEKYAPEGVTEHDLNAGIGGKKVDVAFNGPD